MSTLVRIQLLVTRCLRNGYFTKMSKVKSLNRKHSKKSKIEKKSKIDVTTKIEKSKIEYRKSKIEYRKSKIEIFFETLPNSNCSARGKIHNIEI